MKILKYLFFLILIVLIGGAIYFGTQDGSFDAAGKKVMNAPAAVIFDNVSDFKNWEQWGPWMADDPDLKITYPDTTKGAGGSYSWTSEVMGDGSLRTTSLTANESIDQKITFNTPMGDSESDIYWNFTPTEDGSTEVTWGMKGEQSFMERVFMAFQSEDFETSLQTMYNTGLENLDKTIQESMKQFTVNVEGIKEHGGGYYLYLTASARTENLSQKMGEHYGKIGAFMAQNNIAMNGMPFTIYNEVDDANGTFNFSSALPVKERIITPAGSDVLCGYMEPTSAVKAILKGNYTNLHEAYTKANSYVAENNLIVDSSKKMFEIYANDPGMHPNPSDWTTEVYIPVFKDLRSNHPIINNE